MSGESSSYSNVSLGDTVQMASQWQSQDSVQYSVLHVHSLGWTFPRIGRIPHLISNKFCIILNALLYLIKIQMAVCLVCWYRCQLPSEAEVCVQRCHWCWNKQGMVIFCRGKGIQGISRRPQRPKSGSKYLSLNILAITSLITIAQHMCQSQCHEYGRYKEVLRPCCYRCWDGQLHPTQHETPECSWWPPEGWEVHITCILFTLAPSKTSLSQVY